MFDCNNSYNKNIELNLMSFDLELFDLDYFRNEFYSFSESKDTQYDVTYYMHFLDQSCHFISDNIVFDLTRDNLDGLIEHLYGKICDKYLSEVLDSTKVFYIHIGLRSLNTLDFEIYRLNSFYLSDRCDK